MAEYYNCESCASYVIGGEGFVFALLPSNYSIEVEDDDDGDEKSCFSYHRDSFNYRL